MGGDAQPQIILQVLARWLASGQPPATSVAAGRWVLSGGPTGFDTWLGRGDRLRVVVEGHAPGTWAPGLAARGHRVEIAGEYSSRFGHAHLIVDAGDHLAAGTDPRPRFGASAGY
jgi:gamma-glutamyltranspeptidase/glutathione hydrolase